MIFGRDLLPLYMHLCRTKTKKEKHSFEHFSLMDVRLIGLEPTRLATPDPKSGASTNFATSA